MTLPVFYNQHGQAVAYAENDECIYLYTGTPVAYFDDDSVYSFSGKHLGWFENGWILDNNGYCVFFTDNADGGPMKPFKKFEPFKKFRKFEPFKHFKEFKPTKASIKNSWSELSDDDFFKQ